MSLVCRREGDGVLRIEVARSWGTWAVVAVTGFLGLSMARAVIVSWSRGGWVTVNLESALLMLLAWFIAYFSYRGEPEICFIDRKKKTIRLERYYPFRPVRIMVLPSLDELETVEIEEAPEKLAKGRYKRISFEFSNGLTVPMTESYLDTARGLIVGANHAAGLDAALREIQKFIAE